VSATSLNWEGQTLVFLPQKALWVQEQRLLLIADVHLGKADHLQAHGIAIPSDGEQANLRCIAELTQQWQPAELIVLGEPTGTAARATIPVKAGALAKP
jgi:metallophosphoesterase superfamily enzyme